MWPRLAAALAACAAGLVLVAPWGTAATGDRARLVFTIRDPRVTESSGLAASRLHPGVVYTHNDSGDAARVFAVGPDGRVLATLRLAGVQARDWEAIAPGRDERGRPALFVGDIGDNRGTWPSVAVYRISEPAVLRDATVPARRYRLRYPGGPRDAEALLVDPRSNRLFVASKEPTGGGLYEAPAVLRGDGVNLLRRVGGVPPLVTDGAFAPDGRTFVLRGYLDAYVYAASGRRLDSFGLPAQDQGESITYTGDGRAVLVGSEGLDAPVWRVRLPAAATPPDGTASRAGGRASPGGDGPSWIVAALRGWRAAPLLLVLVVVVVLVVALARRRR
ncbi:MAG TPA: hypothetical protein VGM21_04870 [Actinomycetota bacterium]|jgi:hypothetical protein